MTNNPFVDRVEARINGETGEQFYVAIMAQITPVVSVNGNVSIRQLEKSVPLTDNAVAGMRRAAAAKLEFPGHEIARVSCAPYQWTNPTTGEEATYTHTYEFRRKEAALAAPVQPEVFVTPEPQFAVES